MKLVPYLNFNGDCRQAFEFYQSVLGGEITAMITHEDMGIPGLDEKMKAMILHARLVVGSQVLMGSDIDQAPASPPVPAQVSLMLDTAEEAERVYAALSAGGMIIMPMEEQSWAERFSYFTDRFGVPWMVTCERAE